MRYEPFLSFELCLNLLISRAELLVFCLDLVVELLNAAKMVNVPFEVDFLLLSQGFFH